MLMWLVLCILLWLRKRFKPPTSTLRDYVYLVLGSDIEPNYDSHTIVVVWWYDTNETKQWAIVTTEPYGFFRHPHACVIRQEVLFSEALKHCGALYFNNMSVKNKEIHVTGASGVRKFYKSSKALHKEFLRQIWQYDNSNKALR